MPSRYFPFSQEFNSDPEGWELTNTFGDRMLRVWLQILAIGDRNGGVIKGTPEQWAPVFARTVFSKNNQKWFRRDSETVLKALRWFSEKHWIRIREGSDPALIIVNYAKYHKTRSENSPPPNHPNLSEPSEPLRSTHSPSADSKIVGKKRELDPKIKEVTDLLFRRHREKFIKCRVMTWIGEAQKNNFPTDLIAETLKSFAPRAAEIDNWYPYLDKIIYKLDKDRNRDIHDIEHERNKQETAELAKDMFGDAQVKERAGPDRRRSMSRR
jgi:hypothetical protein